MKRLIHRVSSSTFAIQYGRRLYRCLLVKVKSWASKYQVNTTSHLHCWLIFAQHIFPGGLKRAF